MGKGHKPDRRVGRVQRPTSARRLMERGDHLPSLANCPSSAAVGGLCERGRSERSTFTTEEVIEYVRKCTDKGTHLNPSHIALDQLRGYGLVHRLLNAIPDAETQREADAHAHAARAQREREEMLARHAVSKWEAYVAERQQERANEAHEAHAAREDLMATASLVWMLDTMRDRAIQELTAKTPAGTNIAVRGPGDEQTKAWDFDFMLDAVAQLSERAGLAK